MGTAKRLAQVDERADRRDPRELDELRLDRRRVGGVEEGRVEELVEAGVHERHPEEEEPERQQRRRGDARQSQAPKGPRGRRAGGSPRGPPAPIAAVPPPQSAPGRSAPGRVHTRTDVGRRFGLGLDVVADPARRVHPHRASPPAHRPVMSTHSTACRRVGYPGDRPITSARHAGHESWMCVSPSSDRARGGTAGRRPGAPRAHPVRNAGPQPRAATPVRRPGAARPPRSDRRPPPQRPGSSGRSGRTYRVHVDPPDVRRYRRSSFPCRSAPMAGGGRRAAVPAVVEGRARRLTAAPLGCTNGSRAPRPQLDPARPRRPERTRPP